jgi:two-component system probable response regulator PhcQ
MSNGYDYKQFGVLYVDDEEQSLKYFRKGFERDFRILTASSVNEAIGVIESEGGALGVVVTDQRMPGKTGVDLLGHLRHARPGVVRILATAYSDVDSAIAAVNSGAIYKYVAKPWDPRELRVTLMRAMEFFVVQRERDQLLREKLSVLQRLVVIDRVRSLAALAAGLSHHVRNSMTALTCFLEEMSPSRLREADGAAKDGALLQNLHALAVRESEQILHIVEKVAQTVLEPRYEFADDADLHDLIRRGADDAMADLPNMKKVSIEAAGQVPRLKVDGAMVARLFRLLIARLGRAGGSVLVAAKNGISVWGTPGVQVFISGEGPPWTDEEASALFTPFAYGHDDPQDLGLDVLSAFFIAYHHGGDLIVHKTAPNGPGFEVRLPFVPEATRRPSLEENLLEKLLSHFDIWDSLR